MAANKLATSKQAGQGNVSAINPDNSKYSSAESRAYFIEDALHAFQKEHDGPDEVLVFCCIGHGRVEDDSFAGWAGENDDQKIFGVAYMLEWLRDECEVYLRFILDACFGVIKLPPLQQPRGDGWIIEHLSSVGPDTEAYGAM